MATYKGRPKQVQQMNSFVGGLITEASELNFPPNSSYDELNCVLLPNGTRRRRLGIDFESGYSLSAFTISDSELETATFSSFTWYSVNSNANRNFLVMQIGATVYFYDFGNNPLSGGKKSFTIDLNSYLSPAATNAARDKISCASGKGFLYIVSPRIEPLKVEYNASTDSITVSYIDIRIRDLKGVDDGLDVEEESATLSPEHEYNLLNQGWGETHDGYDPLQTYKTATGVYPPNNMQWFTSKTGAGAINVSALRRYVTGTSQAPKGHFIVDPFYIDRTTVSGVAGLTVESTDDRPSAVAFYSGRVVYLLNSQLYVSQLITDRGIDNEGKCYQDADPTSEDISDLVATDGLVIPIPDAGKLLGAMSLGSALLLFANNGVWSLSGKDGGFTSSDYIIAKVTSAGCLSSSTLVDVDGIPYWWSETGIYRMDVDKVTGSGVATNITDLTIKSFYTSIPVTKRSEAVGEYDKATKTVIWMYKDDDEAPISTTKNYFTRILNFNVILGAFYPQALEQISAHSPYVVGFAASSNLNETTTTENVVISNGNNIIVTSTDNVIVGLDVTLAQDTFIKYITVVPNSSSTANNITFSLFNDTNFCDWATWDALKNSGNGAEFESFLETGFDLFGDLARFKDTPYITVHCKRTETAIDYPGPVYTNPSSLFLRTKWEFSSGSQSGKWTTRQQAYRLNPLYVPTADDTDWENGFYLTTTRLRVRGNGRALQLRFESEPRKDFQLLGWGLVVAGNTEV